MFSVFNDYIDLIDNFFPFERHCSGLVLNLILFHTDKAFESQLSDLQRIKILFAESQHLAVAEMTSTKRENFNFKTSSLFFVLNKMRSIFENLEVSLHELDPAAKVPKLAFANFTETEDFWLQKSFA